MEIKRVYSKAIKCTLIGCGNIGSRWDEIENERHCEIARTHIKAILKNPFLEISGLYDLSPARAAEASRFWNVKNILNLEDIHSGNTDLLVLATPPEGRIDLIEKFRAKGIKSFFLEKPLSSNFLEAKDFFTRRSSELNIIVNYSRTFCPGYSQLAAEVVSGKYGHFQGGFGYYAKGFKNNGSHVLSLLSMLFVKLEDVTNGIKVSDGFDHDPTCNISLKAQGKAINILAADYNKFSVFELDLLFTNGKIRILESGSIVEVYSLKADELYPTYKILSLNEKRKIPLEFAMTYGYDDVVKFLNGDPCEAIKRNFKVTENLLDIYSRFESKE